MADSGLELYRSGFKSCVTLDRLFSISFLLHKIELETVPTSSGCSDIKHGNMYTLLGTRKDDKLAFFDLFLHFIKI